MIAQIGWMQWRGISLQIGGRGDEQPRWRSEAPRDCAGIGKRAEAEGDVHAILHQFLTLVIHAQVHAQGGVEFQEGWQAGDQFAHAEA